MTSIEFLLNVVGIALFLSIGMTVAWLIWRRTGNAGWVDTVWTFSVGVTGFLGALLPGLLSHGFTQRQYLVAFFILVWSLRLGIFIAQRTQGITDDPRYAKLTRAWGQKASQQMFWLLQKQAWVSIPLALAIVLAAWNPVLHLRIVDFLAIALLAAAIVGETIADRQLRQFRLDKNSRGKICDVGLWSWSRHPNYFFQWLGWLAYPLLAIDPAGIYVWGWFAISAPICIYWLLVYVSGIPPLENHMLATRGDAFRAYQTRTNAFFPAPPRAT